MKLEFGFGKVLNKLLTIKTKEITYKWMTVSKTATVLKLNQKGIKNHFVNKKVLSEVPIYLQVF